MSRPTGRRLIAENRRARHDYELLEKMEAGIVLKGTEVKSIRGGKVQLKDSYVEIRDGDAYLVGAHISPYSHGNIQNHDPERPRRLLLNRREIDRIFGKTTIQGLTCVPLSIYLSGNLVKLEVAIARGKKLYDKRQAEKKKRMAAEAEEAIRGARR
ncbi:MAG: SsrA-binding protein SmpB [Acidobacteria bacterium]|nr:SsrA-binding protein SmpB [Acidobacteriota bacterium]